MTETLENSKARKEKPLFSLDSIMDKSDLRRMIYIATFFRNAWYIPAVFGVSFVINLIMAKFKKIDSIGLIFFSFIVLSIVAFLLVCFQIELKNKNRVKYDGPLILNRPLRLNFFDDRIEATTGKVEETSSLKYSGFVKLMETKEYYLFFHNATQISLLRKLEIDVDEEEPFNKFIKTKFEGKYKELKFI